MHVFTYGEEINDASPKHGFPLKRDIWPSPTRSWGHRDTTLQIGTVPPNAGRLVTLYILCSYPCGSTSIRYLQSKMRTDDFLRSLSLPNSRLHFKFINYLGWSQFRAVFPEFEDRLTHELVKIMDRFFNHDCCQPEFQTSAYEPRYEVRAEFFGYAIPPLRKRKDSCSQSIRYIGQLSSDDINYYGNQTDPFTTAEGPWREMLYHGDDHRGISRRSCHVIFVNTKKPPVFTGRFYLARTASAPISGCDFGPPVYLNQQANTSYRWHQEGDDEAQDEETPRKGVNCSHRPGATIGVPAFPDDDENAFLSADTFFKKLRDGSSCRAHHDGPKPADQYPWLANGRLYAIRDGSEVCIVGREDYSVMILSAEESTSSKKTIPQGVILNPVPHNLRLLRPCVDTEGFNSSAEKLSASNVLRSSDGFEPLRNTSLSATKRLEAKMLSKSSFTISLEGTVRHFQWSLMLRPHDTTTRDHILVGSHILRISTTRGIMTLVSIAKWHRKSNNCKQKPAKHVRLTYRNTKLFKKMALLGVSFNDVRVAGLAGHPPVTLIRSKGFEPNPEFEFEFDSWNARIKENKQGHYWVPAFSAAAKLKTLTVAGLFHIPPRLLRSESEIVRWRSVRPSLWKSAVQLLTASNTAQW
ncbi:unnamed protein product [Nesidiocoris tenuis]|uniref:Uncharacterized protein n=1 Tax=Nesidiocoris tenuis TaxID=355587 RepID=A0A6H5G4Q0_9HEMI|nr:unnamed protein product [Nesidiocoris tenuis]